MSLQLGQAFIEQHQQNQPNQPNQQNQPNNQVAGEFHEVFDAEYVRRCVVDAYHSNDYARFNANMAHRHADAAWQHADTHAAAGDADIANIARHHAYTAIDHANDATNSAAIAEEAFLDAVAICNEAIMENMGPEIQVSVGVAFAIATTAANVATAARTSRFAAIASQEARQLAAGAALTDADSVDNSDTWVAVYAVIAARRRADHAMIAYENAALMQE
jgi:hypothetical protein